MPETNLKKAIKSLIAWIIPQAKLWKVISSSILCMPWVLSTKPPSKATGQSTRHQPDSFKADSAGGNFRKACQASSSQTDLPRTGDNQNTPGVCVWVGVDHKQKPELPFKAIFPAGTMGDDVTYFGYFNAPWVGLPFFSLRGSILGNCTQGFNAICW